MIYRKSYYYGILLPFLASLVFAVLFKLIAPAVLNDIANGIKARIELFLAAIGIFAAVSAIFAQKILFEDNPIVLDITKDNIRKGFLISIKIQFPIIALCILLLATPAFLKNSFVRSDIIIYVIFVLLLEFYFMFTNGLHYSKLREKIIVSTNNKSNKSASVDGASGTTAEL